MEADFSGYATKAGLKCSDGRTIMPGAFKHQDKMKVPLVWQHGHTDPENVLGHVYLEARDDGVYCRAFFNKTAKAVHARELIDHDDINQLSIWANQLIEKSKTVLHGVIKEVSLVLSGANPGAVIDNISIRHSDDDVETLDDEAIITTGLNILHSDQQEEEQKKDEPEDKKDEPEDKKKEDALQHAEGDELTVQEVYDSLTDVQKDVVSYMIGEALESADELKQDDVGDDGDDNHDDTKGSTVKHNAFEDDKKEEPEKHIISHDDMQAMLTEAKKGHSLKAIVEDYAFAHGIEDIDLLFPDAKALSDTPELFGRKVEWVDNVMSKVRKSPFSRIKTFSADITVPEARAKGYIKGTLKKEEFFRVARRVTVPTTVYKKQGLDRDDLVDITDFDVVAWMKAEMRIMLEEELARAILFGDGRAADDDDKIDEEKLRPVATDHELYTTTITVNIGDVGSNMSEVVDAIAQNRGQLRGTGLPTMYTTETYIARWMTQRDQVGRRLYKNLEELASELRVAEVVPVEALEGETDIVAILVNLSDYTVGATAGGQVSLFDDFDIDYNKYKYLIETRCSGALNKLKAAMVVRRSGDADVVVTPADPAFDGTAVTITNQTGVVYRNADTDAVINAAGSPYPVAEGATLNVVAEPAAGYFFPSSDVDNWSFTNEPA